LTNPNNADELMPSNTGIDNLNIEGQINQYNTLKTEKRRVKEEQ
jgi:hypothetical protein